MADIKIAAKDVERATNDNMGVFVDINGEYVIAPIPSAVIGIAIEGSIPLEDYPGVHTVQITNMMAATPPYSDGLYITDADTAMKTLPRIVQRMIYRYAKWSCGGAKQKEADAQE